LQSLVAFLEQAIEQRHAIGVGLELADGLLGLLELLVQGDVLLGLGLETLRQHLDLALVFITSILIELGIVGQRRTTCRDR